MPTARFSLWPRRPKYLPAPNILLRWILSRIRKVSWEEYVEAPCQKADRVRIKKKKEKGERAVDHGLIV